MPCKFSEQKKMKKYKKGGKVDAIPAWLTEGEYVIKLKSAKNIGYDNLDYMNKTGKIPIKDARKRSKKNA